MYRRDVMADRVNGLTGYGLYKAEKVPGPYWEQLQLVSELSLIGSLSSVLTFREKYLQHVATIGQVHWSDTCSRTSRGALKSI